jgi:protoporphyrinogen oxidase
LFNIFFKTFTEKVWGVSCRGISADWASQRIKDLSLAKAILRACRGPRRDSKIITTLIEEFQYPRRGPGMMWEKTRDDLIQGGVRVAMGQKVEEIHTEGERVAFVRSRTLRDQMEDWPADEFIVSMPLRDCVLSMRPRLPEVVEAAARTLQYRDIITVALIIEGSSPFPDNWIYVHDPSVRVGRVQNFNNWSLGMVPRAGVTCLGLEYFCTMGDTLWSLSDAELIELGSRELDNIGLVRGRKVLDGCVARMEKAYPVYHPTYQADVSIIRAALARFKNLQPVGRNGMHKYNNQDHSMMTALLAARNLMGDYHDPWKVNADAEYHETASSAMSAGRMAPSVG